MVTCLLTSIAELRKHLTDIPNIVILVSRTIGIAQERLLRYTQYPLGRAIDGNRKCLALRNRLGHDSQ